MKDKHRMTRRDFVRNTAIVAATGAASIGALGSLGPTQAVAAPVPEKWDQKADVIVAGSGPTGLPAAIAAVEKGASVIVLEQGKEIGGCGIISGGILSIGGGTRIQKLNNVEETIELLFKKLSNYQNASAKRNDPELLRVFCNHNPGILEWLEQRGVRFMNSMTKAGSGGAMHQKAYHHIWWDKEGPGAAFVKTPEGVTSGAGLIKPLEAYARKKGVKILTEHKLNRIIRENGTQGKVVGVEVQAGKKKLNFKANKAVILGTGSWKGHKFMRKLFDSRITENVAFTGDPFVNADGSGIQAALEVGAVLMSDRAEDTALYRRKFGTKHYNFPLNSPYGAPGLPIGGGRTADVIFINKFGKRFVSEEDVASLGTYGFFDAALAQEGHVLWTIFDDVTAKKHKWTVSTPYTEEGAAYSAATLAELAKAIKIPGDALVETVRNYNSYVDKGSDPDFNKPKKLLRTKIETPPFYGVWISIYVHDTCGGLAINTKAQVLDIYGKVIPGLYAGGEAAGGVDFAGMPRGIIFGRIAGENAAAG